MTLIIPKSARVSRSNPLREWLESRDGKKFVDEVAMTAAVSKSVQRVVAERKLANKEVLGSLVCVLVSAAQHMAPPDEWGAVGDILADVVKSRLTVTGENSHGE